MFNSFFSHWRQFFDYFEKKGLHITPCHYYSAIPNTRDIDPNLPGSRSLVKGITFMTYATNDWIKDFKNLTFEFMNLENVDLGISTKYNYNCDAYQSGDSEVLYGAIRTKKPKLIIEIGSGMSTLVSLSAIKKNIEEDPSLQSKLISIEPYPPSYISEISQNKNLPFELIECQLQKIPMTLFKQLGKDDILFIDSSHVSSIGSDVNYEYLKIIPDLNSGVIVHIHDIFTPYEYPANWIFKDRFFWNEQYLLQSFLTFNKEFKVIWPGHLIHRENPKKLEQIFPHYVKEKHRPSNFWIQSV